MIAHRGEQPAAVDALRDGPRGREVERERLLDEERQVALERGGLERAVRERGHAQPHRVELLHGEEREPVVVGPRAVAGRRLFRALGKRVGDGHDIDGGKA